MAAKAGKKGKKKGTTMALTDFLSDEQGNSQGPGSSYVLANKSIDWAAEMEELDNSDTMYGAGPAVDRLKLPTAPKASRGPEDMENVPKDPPYTAFIGNLPYEASEEKITEFFGQLAVVNVRLPEDNGRFRGFGYVEFETRQALIDALLMSEETFSGRKIRIDLAGQSQHGDGRSGGRRDDGQPDRTEGDWRRSEPKDTNNDRGPSRYDDRGGDRGGSRGFEDRSSGGFGGGSRYEDRGGSRGFEDRGNRGYGDRGSDRGGDSSRSDSTWERSGGDARDGGSSFGRRDDRRDDRGGGGRYDDRRDDGGGRRAFGSGFRDDRDGGDRRGYGGDFGRDRDRGYGGDRDRGYGGDRSRGYGDRGGERGGDRGESTWERQGGDARDGGDSRYSRSDRGEAREAVSEAPKERPRLNLQPRTKPAEEIKREKEQKAPAKSSASIFGSAKPVDTAQREREIEERMRKQKTEPPTPNKSSLESRGYGESKGYQDPMESRDGGERRQAANHSTSDRNYQRQDSGSSRPRSDSDRSQETDGHRERRHSSGSSKGKRGSRKNSGDKSSQSDGMSVGEDGMSPGQREDPHNFVPAPPPKANVWEIRKSTTPQQTPSSTAQRADSRHAEPRSAEPRSPPPAKDVKSDTSVSSRSPGTHTSHPGGGKPSGAGSHSAAGKPGSHKVSAPPGDSKKDFVPAEPPKENPWMKRKQEQELHTTSRPEGPTPSSAPAPVHSAWAGRGGGRGGRGGYGRGEPHRNEKKERPLPQSVDEMPKMEEKKDKDFSDSNKFAGLMEDDDGGYDAES